MGIGDPNEVLILSQQVLPTEAPKSTVKTPECFQSPTSDIADQYHVWIQVTCVEIFFLLLCILCHMYTDALGDHEPVTWSWSYRRL